mmetsp:Transcript_22243/g.39399  ORF Transcript_22243/g.39399 Transcript_22243/m.39399 type:complete len:139 (-) Transcript_22243:36-452(-)
MRMLMRTLPAERRQIVVNQNVPNQNVPGSESYLILMMTRMKSLMKTVSQPEVNESNEKGDKMQKKSAPVKTVSKVNDKKNTRAPDEGGHESSRSSRIGLRRTRSAAMLEADSTKSKGRGKQLTKRAISHSRKREKGIE